MFLPHWGTKCHVTPAVHNWVLVLCLTNGYLIAPRYKGTFLSLRVQKCSFRSIVKRVQKCTNNKVKVFVPWYSPEWQGVCTSLDTFLYLDFSVFTCPWVFDKIGSHWLCSGWILSLWPDWCPVCKLTWHFFLNKEMPAKYFSTYTVFHLLWLILFMLNINFALNK